MDGHIQRPTPNAQRPTPNGAALGVACVLLFLLLAMIDLGTPRPLEEAIASLSSKTPIGSLLRSADWLRVPLALRESAFFSAGVESARFLQIAQDRLLSLVKLQRERLAGGKVGAFLSRERFIVELRQMANDLGIDTTLAPGDAGTVRDITSDARLGMIFDIQTQRAAEFAKWKTEQDPDVLDAFPAQELVRIESREVPRKWTQRWVNAGGTLREGRMIALKTDGIWSRISRFGSPWPPFDFNSGMGLEDISHNEAVRLGLLAQGERVEPQNIDFNANLKASVRGLNDRMKSRLENIFGDQINLAGDEARWNSDQAHELARSRDREIVREVSARSTAALATARSLDGRHSGSDAIQAATERQWGAEIGAVAAGRKRLFHEGPVGDDAKARAEGLKGKLPDGVEVMHRDGHWYVWRPDTLPVSIDEAHTLSLENKNGHLLGYGANLGDPGLVVVHLVDRHGEVVGGFHGDPKTARKWGRRRANDYAIAWDEPISVRVYDR